MLTTGVLLAALLTASACQPPETSPSDVAVTWKLTPNPPRTGTTTLVTVTLTDSAEASITGARVALEGTMTHPGMQPVLSDAEEVAPGQYEAEMTFTMGGDWILLLDAVLPDGRAVQQQKEVRGVRTP